jgi:hypothetical protein
MANNSSTNPYIVREQARRLREQAAEKLGMTLEAYQAEHGFLSKTAQEILDREEA